MKEDNYSQKYDIKLLIIALMIITLCRLWLQMSLNYVVVYASIDDNVAMLQAEALIKHQWLGTYNMMTLAKGTTYAFFLYTCHCLHIPYSLGLGLLICGSSLYMAHALYRISHSKICLLFSYTAISYLPIGHQMINQMYFYRNALVPWLSLIILASAIHLIHDALESHSWHLRHTMTLGLSLSTFIELREDYLWILLPCLIIFVFLIKKMRLKSLVINTMIIGGIIGSFHYELSALNYHYYGIRLVNDRTSGPFATMMSQLYSIADDHTNETVWITPQMLEQAIDASDHLSSIRTCIMHSYDNWAYAYFPKSGLIEGDFLQWVMRNALYEAGYYHDNAVKTQAFLTSVTNELQTAFDTHIIERDHHLKLSSQLHHITMTDLIRATGKAVILSFKSLNYPQCFSYYPQAPIASSGWVKRWETLTYMHLSEQNLSSHQMAAASKLTAIITIIYRAGLWGSLVVLCLMHLFTHARAMSYPRAGLLMIIAIFAGICALSLMVALFTSFLTDFHFYKYTSPLVMMVVIMKLVDLNDLLMTLEE